MLERIALVVELVICIVIVAWFVAKPTIPTIPTYESRISTGGELPNLTPMFANRQGNTHVTFDVVDNEFIIIK